MPLEVQSWLHFRATVGCLDTHVPIIYRIDLFSE